MFSLQKYFRYIISGTMLSIGLVFYFTLPYSRTHLLSPTVGNSYQYPVTSGAGLEGGTKWRGINGSFSSLSSPPSEIKRLNATFVTLARNTDLWELVKSISQIESRFNQKFKYDWVFLNDVDFDENFKRVTSALVSGQAKYGKIAKEQWSFPSFIDQNRAAQVRQQMREKKIIYGDSVSYRHMCRYESGFFFRHPLMMDYDWYWRVEPSINFYCDLPYDPFRFMEENGKKYSFTISLYEYVDTVPTLWNSVRKFFNRYPSYLAKDNSLAFLSDNNGESYNLCHFWSNFEIANLNWLRSKPYLDFFNFLDHEGGFFYERWGDAPVHSIAAGLMLNRSEIHFFSDIGYSHVPFTHCVADEKLRLERRCTCNPADNFDWDQYSCTKRFHAVNGLPHP